MPSLREVREYKALTQRELAEMAKVSRTTIVHIEAGKAPPIMSTRRQIANALGVLPGEIDWPKGAVSNGKAAGDGR